ncbi:hypothetical protein FRC12_010107 [Ceratobasidium sp. 428]|nr:hypothetical protein FRC12_010107 [Ceratobasidium sp. 428]
MTSDIDRRGLGMADTKIEGFHQIIAVTQGSINLQLQQRHAAYPELRQLDVVLPPSGKHSISKAKLSANMDPMQVQLGISTENHSVYCYLFLRKGAALFFEDGEYESISIRDWRVAFKVDLNLQTEKPEQVPEHIKRRLQKAGDYRANKVSTAFYTSFVSSVSDDHAADIANYDQAKSILPGLTYEDDPSITAQRQVQLGTLLKTWTDSLKQQTDQGQPHNILGYSITVSHPQGGYPFTPSLVPTSIRHQNYPYLQDAGASPTSDLFGPLKSIGDNNMFAYLQMTNHELLPKAALNYSANWAVNKPDQPAKGGTLAISNQCLFESCLLPKLADLNRDTAIKAIRAEHSGYDPETIQFDFQLGRMFNKDSDPRLYQWKKTDDPLRWEFAASTFEESHHDSLLTKTLSIHGSLRCDFKHVLEVTPSLNEIRITGHLATDRVRRANFFNNKKLRLDDDKHAQEIENIFHNGLNVESAVTDLNNMFKGPWNFYFPGTGVYFLTHPIFNKEGDLLVELQHADGANEDD